MLPAHIKKGLMRLGFQKEKSYWRRHRGGLDFVVYTEGVIEAGDRYDTTYVGVYFDELRSRTGRQSLGSIKYDCQIKAMVSDLCDGLPAKLSEQNQQANQVVECIETFTAELSDIATFLSYYQTTRHAQRARSLREWEVQVYLGEVDVGDADARPKPHAINGEVRNIEELTEWFSPQ